MTLSEFKSIFNQYYSPIKNFLYYKSGDIDLSEDITQDVFMKLWDKREDVQQETVKSYLYTIANNMLLNKIRHDKVVMSFAEKNKSNNEPNAYPGTAYPTKIRIDEISSDTVLCRTALKTPSGMHII